jgi:hypothetical protein
MCLKHNKSENRQANTNYQILHQKYPKQAAFLSSDSYSVYKGGCKTKLKKEKNKIGKQRESQTLAKL